MACNILQVLLDGFVCTHLKAPLVLKSEQSAQAKQPGVPTNRASLQKMCLPCQKKGEMFWGVAEYT